MAGSWVGASNFSSAVHAALLLVLALDRFAQLIIDALEVRGDLAFERGEWRLFA